MSKKILITGGTGSMGSELVKALLEKGYMLRVLTLPGDSGTARIDKTKVDIRYGDIANEQDIDGVCESVDTVLHLAAIIISNNDSQFDRINAGGTQNIVKESEKAGVKNFIHVSSASVTYTKPTPYSLSKRVAERVVRESKLSWTIVRPTLVYGVKGGLEFDMYLKYLRRFPVVPFIGKGTSLKRPVYVGDIVDGLLKLIDKGQGCNRIYNFSGAHSISMLDFSKLCLTLMGDPNKKIVHFPVWFCSVLAEGMRLIFRDPPLKWSVIAGITQDANLDPGDAIREIGYAPSALYEKLPECFSGRVYSK